MKHALCGFPCENEEEVKKDVEGLIARYQDKYDLKVIDKRIKQTRLSDE